MTVERGDDGSGGAELVPVEELRPGDRLELPRGRRVTVERVDSYPLDEEGGLELVVRWWVRQRRYAPAPWIRTDYSAECAGGRYLGSLRPMRPGERVPVVSRSTVEP